MLKLYEQRRSLLHELLLIAKSDGLEVDWALPSGGMSLWLNTHRNSDALAQNVAEAGVRVTPESRYCNHANAGTHVRLGFACLNEKEIITGTRILLAEIEKMRRKKHV